MSRSDHYDCHLSLDPAKKVRRVQSTASGIDVAGEPKVVSLEPLTVRISTAVKLTGIGRSKLYELIASGDLDIVKVGTATLVTMASLRRLTRLEAS